MKLSVFFRKPSFECSAPPPKPVCEENCGCEDAANRLVSVPSGRDAKPAETELVKTE